MSGVHDDLATLPDLARSALTAYEGYTGPWGDDAPTIADAAIRLAHGILAMEAEIARLREQRDILYRANQKQIDLVRAAEARCARLQQALQRIASTDKPDTHFCTGVAREALAGLDTPADSQPEDAA